MNKNNIWIKPVAVMLVAVLMLASIFIIVELSEDKYNIIPAETVEIDGQTYDVLDLITDSDMEQVSSELSKFTDLDNLNEIVGQEGNDDVYYYWGGIEPTIDFEEADNSGGLAMEDSAPTSSDASYSTTNTQVSGVDEGDIVKNDAKYAYIASGDRQSLFIIDAYPANEANIVSEIQTQGSIQEIYIVDDLLIVIQQENYYQENYEYMDYSYAYSPESSTIFITVFNVEDRAEPVQFKNASLTGYFSTSRVIGNNLYLISEDYNYGIYENESELPLPIDCLYYMEDINAYYSLTSFLTMDFTDADSNPGVMGIYMSSASTIYVSTENIYITHMKPYDYEDDWSWEDYEENTVIHRIRIQGKSLKYMARGEVPGWVLNRYSMDEFNGHFRIATTKGWSWNAGEEQSRNIVTVMSMALNKTGVLDNIAPGEQIYSARFMGQRCYLVTFRQVDPFFVIDLHDAENPQILGELKIPGYSSYLHPYDDNHIIGLGKENSSVKISLFNVTDVSNPTELANIQVGSEYSDSIALYDPHAFTFDYEKKLLVIPVYQYSYSYFEGSDDGYSAMVFHIGLDGITNEASIEHPEQNTNWDYYYYPQNQVRRSFFIGDILYTVSETHLKANNLENYGQEALVELK